MALVGHPGDGAHRTTSVFIGARSFYSEDYWADSDGLDRFGTDQPHLFLVVATT